MSAQPVLKRRFHTFLSHAHLDNAVADQLNHWLFEVAGVPVWYDATHLPPGSMIAAALPQVIDECRGMMIAVSKASLQSGWVEEEYSAAIGHRTRFKDFRIVPVRIDESEIPGFLGNRKWIDLASGQIDLRAANELLAGIYGEDVSAESGTFRDVYVSRSWRENEAALGDWVCTVVDERGFRLVGDSKDQAGFLGGERVRSIISSCGALVAVLPDRGEGKTSEYMLEEISHARDFELPCLIVAEPGLKLSPELDPMTIRISVAEVAPGSSARGVLQRGLDRIDEEWRKPSEPHYVFLATSFGNEHAERNRLLRQVIERVTAMPCVIGDDVREGQIQQRIVDLVRGAFLVIADVSEENLNTCIEAGVALGAQRPLYLVAAGPRHAPPFLFRGYQVWYYADEAALVGIMHRIAFPYRRRVLNRELRR
jgi:hypothetical protein